MRDEHLQYFKALFEGRADISWRAWVALDERGRPREDLRRKA